jgi:CheY-like chemotaxis protein
VNRQVVQLMIGASTDLSQAANGAEGLQATERDKFDLILMDMQMPVLDGLSATRAIRRREAARGEPRTPIIMLTANVLAEQVELCRAAGADLHLSKPVTAAALYAGMQTALLRALAPAAAGAPPEGGRGSPREPNGRSSSGTGA